MLANRRSIRYNVYLHDTIYVILFHFRKGGGRSFRRNGPCRYMKQTDELRPAVAPLWTRDFTIITLGSVVSMLGNAMSGFALSLLVLDYTESSLLYAIYIATFTAPQIIAPIFSGAILDRFSRKRTIYTLDFISAGIYAMAAFILSRGWFSFPVLAVWCFIIGTINSIYMVAYESFYPMLITEGNYSKAYSIASVLETLSAVMIPISTYVYNKVGIAPLLPHRCHRGDADPGGGEVHRDAKGHGDGGRVLRTAAAAGHRGGLPVPVEREGAAGGSVLFRIQLAGRRRVPGHHAALFQGGVPQRRIRVHAGVGHDGGGPYRRWAGTL